MNRVGLKHIALNRFPLKHICDSLSLMQILLRGDPNYRRSLSPKQKLNCMKFYFTANGIDRLYATLPRSGFHYTMLAVEIALDLANGGDGEYYFEREFWWPKTGVRYNKLDWRTPINDPTKLGLYPVDTILYHTHQPFYRLRCARINKMKIIVQVRNIIEQLNSWSYRAPFSGVEPGQFPWRRHLADSIRFQNSWGDYIRHHDNVHTVKYEEVLASPAKNIETMMEFWGLDVPARCIEKAIEMTTKEEMKKRLSKDSIYNKIISFGEYRTNISCNITRNVIKIINKELLYDFGYTYN